MLTLALVLKAVIGRALFSGVIFEDYKQPTSAPGLFYWCAGHHWVWQLWQNKRVHTKASGVNVYFYKVNINVFHQVIVVKSAG